MTIVIIVLIFVVIFFFYDKHKTKKMRQEYEGYEYNKPPPDVDKIKRELGFNISEDYSDDDWDEYEPFWDSTYREPKHYLLESEFPFFEVIQREKKVFDFIDSKFSKLTNNLSSIKDDYIKNSISTLIGQDKFRETKNLPGYLKSVPIKKMISLNIFVQPDESHLSEILNSLTMVILKNYCSDLGIKSGKSKKDTIERLLETSVRNKINFKDYFKLNSDVTEINKQVNKYYQMILRKLLDQRKIIIKDIRKPLDPDRSDKFQKKGKHKLLEYGDNYIYFSNDKPKFRYDVGENDGSSIYDHNLMLLKNGMVLYTLSGTISNSSVTKSYLINDNKKIVSEYKINDTSGYFYGDQIIELFDKPIVCIEKSNNKYWTLNYETMEEKIFDNPDNKNIYSLFDEE